MCLSDNTFCARNVSDELSDMKLRSDGLKSLPSIHEAVTLISDVKQMCKSGGFNLHKFVSNSKDVIRRILESDKADGVKELVLHLPSFPLESLTLSYRTSRALEEEYFLRQVRFLTHLASLLRSC